MADPFLVAARAVVVKHEHQETRLTFMIVGSFYCGARGVCAHLTPHPSHNLP